jgi:hypothetical protein
MSTLLDVGHDLAFDQVADLLTDLCNDFHYARPTQSCKVVDLKSICWKNLAKTNVWSIDDKKLLTEFLVQKHDETVNAAFGEWKQRLCPPPDELLDLINGVEIICNRYVCSETIKQPMLKSLNKKKIAVRVFFEQTDDVKHDDTHSSITANARVLMAAVVRKSTYSYHKFPYTSIDWNKLIAHFKCPHIIEHLKCKLPTEIRNNSFVLFLVFLFEYSMDCGDPLYKYSEIDTAGFNSGKRRIFPNLHYAAALMLLLDPFLKNNCIPAVLCEAMVRPYYTHTIVPGTFSDKIHTRNLSNQYMLVHLINLSNNCTSLVKIENNEKKINSDCLIPSGPRLLCDESLDDLQREEWVPQESVPISKRIRKSIVGKRSYYNSFTIQNKCSKKYKR